MALTICTLEMKDVMVKMLPEALLILSKISATIYIAIAVLEFLSSKFFIINSTTKDVLFFINKGKYYDCEAHTIITVGHV